MTVENNKNLKIVFPGGAGGNWLAHLIYCLENNITEIVIQLPGSNFHKFPRSSSVQIGHWVENHPNCIVFSTKYCFNISLNVFYKTQKFTLPTDKLFNNISQSTSYQLSNLQWKNDYLDQIDLQYELLFVDPNLFLDKLFFILDNNKISYYKNKEFALQSIENFKNSCINVLTDYDNFDSVFWLGWCSGILHVENIPANVDYANVDLKLIAKQFKSRRKFFCDYSKPFILF